MKFIICLVSMLLLAPSLWAKAVTGLYDARVPVPNQQSEHRKEGAKAGLIEVIHKVSGFSVPADNTVINQALKNADQYLYQFSYEAVEKDQWDASIPPGSSWLKMRFEEKAIQRIIKQAQLPLWGSNRPTILVWAMIDENPRRVVIDGEESLVVNSLTTAAQQRGVPVVLPLYDLEDAIRLPQENLWGLFAQPILQASERYEVDSVAAVRLYKNADSKWVGQWRFYFKDREYRFEFESDGLLNQMLSGISASTEVLANTYAIKPTDQGADAIRIQVSGINNLKDYAQLVNYLERLSVTKGVYISSIKGSDMELNVALNGTLIQFNQVIKLDNKLSENEQGLTLKPESELDHVQPGVIRFKWQP